VAPVLLGTYPVCVSDTAYDSSDIPEKCNKKPWIAQVGTREPNVTCAAARSRHGRWDA
jgi:hypothetical protein